LQQKPRGRWKPEAKEKGKLFVNPKYPGVFETMRSEIEKHRGENFSQEY